MNLAIIAIDVHSFYLGRSFQVVMVKGDTALDMRGRCSAGQKVCKPSPSIQKSIVRLV